MVPGIGPVLAKNLLSYCGGAGEVFKQKEKSLLKIPGIGKKHAANILAYTDFSKPKKELEFIDKGGIEILFFTDSRYPEKLRHIADAPLVLYYKGNDKQAASLQNGKMVAIVGTRASTEFGKEYCQQLVKDLVPYQCTIVSGLAYGIDIAAHKAAVDNHIPTVGVLAHGLDRVYPAQHTNTAKKMEELGGLLSEYPSGTNPDRENFPARNRIVAGMCDALVVVETDLKGGAMITADIAFGYNRDVFAVPGNPASSKSKGCNYLIKNNKAALIDSAADIAEMMGWGKEPAKKQVKSVPQNLGELENKIATQLLEAGSMGIDELAFKTGIELNKVSLILLELELVGMVKSLPGKVYKLA